jgi:hypothetical protein
LFEDEDTVASNKPIASSSTFSKRGMGFLFRGKEKEGSIKKGDEKKPKSLFGGEEEEDVVPVVVEKTKVNVKVESKPAPVQAVVVSSPIKPKRNIYDDEPTSLFDNDDNGTIDDDDDDDEDDDDSNSNGDDDDDEAIALKISKIMKPLSSKVHLIPTKSVKSTNEISTVIPKQNVDGDDYSSITNKNVTATPPNAHEAKRNEEDEDGGKEDDGDDDDDKGDDLNNLKRQLTREKKRVSKLEEVNLFSKSLCVCHILFPKPTLVSPVT